jgi:hypothetical protein
MMVPDEKGHALEIAVHAIEAVILESSPSLHGEAFQIERRKTVTVDGVHHEIDVFAKVGAAKGYESIFIFECKNWETPVGKNEIIIFSEKIDAAVAQRGYFVAKEFTKDALAQAAKDKRITVLYVTEHDPTNVPPPESFHFTAPACVKCSATFRVAGTSGTKPDALQVEGKLIRLRGSDVLLADYLTLWLDELYAQRLLWFYTADLPEGVHPLVVEDRRSFGAGELFIDGRGIEHVHLQAEFGVEIIRPAVISDYEVSNRGRVIRLAKAKIRDFAIDTSFVLTLTN